MFSSYLQNKFKFWGIIAVASVGFAGYYYAYRKAMQLSVNKKQIVKNSVKKQQYKGKIHEAQQVNQMTQQSLPVQPSLFSLYYFDKTLHLLQVLDKLDLSQSNLIQSIYNQSPYILIDQYNKFTEQIRKRRRLIRTIDQDQYVELVLEYQRELDQLMERGRMELLEESQIDQQNYHALRDIYDATEDLQALTRKAKHELKLLGNNKKRNIPKQTMLRIINQEVFFIKSRLYDRLRTKLQQQQYGFEISQQQILKVVQQLITDIIYENYGYEAEQIQNSCKNQWALQLKCQIKQLNSLRNDLERDILNFTMNSQPSDDEQDEDQKPKSQQKTRSNASRSKYSQSESNQDEQQQQGEQDDLIYRSQHI